MNRHVIYILLLVLTSCNNDLKNKSIVNDEIKSKIGKELILPLIHNKFDSCNYKVITYIDGDCPSCLVNLELWDSFINKINYKDSTLFICYLHSSNFDYLKNNYSFFSNPIFIIVEDKDKLFFKKNNLSENKILHTFLTNHNNNILLVGNPIFNKNLANLYLKLLNGELII